MSDTDAPAKPGLEQWTNETRSQTGIARADERAPRGHRIDLILPGRTFAITPEDRRLNATLIGDTRKDPFQNGRFSLQAAVETAEDVEELRSNPNTISQSEIEQLFVGGNMKQFNAQIAKITSVDAIQRVLDYANSSGAAQARIDAVQARFDEIRPKTETPEAPAAGRGAAGQEPWYPPAGRGPDERGAGRGPAAKVG